MARKTIDASKTQGAWMLRLVGMIRAVQAELPRFNNVMDYTRAGADFSPLAAALGCTTPEAEALYSRFRSIENTMNGSTPTGTSTWVDFTNLSDIDQGG